MNSATPGDAVQDVVDAFTERGFRDLVYVVHDVYTGDRIGYFNGWGEEIDTKTVEAAAEAARRVQETVPDEPVVSVPLPEDVESDEPVAESDEGDDGETTRSTHDTEPLSNNPETSDDELVQLAESLNQE
jgi:hypothetical protein